MPRLKRLFNLWLPVVAWCGLLFYLSSIPNLKAAQNPFLDEIIRSIVHLIFYAILYLLLFRALKEKKNFWLPLILTILYGLSDEIHQSFVPTRTFQVKDLVVNSLGAAAGWLSLWKLLPKAPEKLKNWAKRLAVI